MMDTVWRVTWALPLVLTVGVIAVLVLRRFVVPAQSPDWQVRRMSVRESITLSDDTRVYLIDIDSRAFVVVESAKQALLQAVQPVANDSTGSSTRFGPRWMPGFNKAGPR
jgi:flagellar biogenesis protein FliO